MQSLLTKLQVLFADAISSAYPDLNSNNNIVEVTSTSNLKFGQYQCNSAMKLAKPLHQAPRLVAETIIAHLKKLSSYEELIESCEIAGPGFINLTLKTNFLSQYIQAMLIHEKLGIDPTHQAKIVIDFSGPNIAKEMHVGHLRSTIIGDCIARLFEFLGYDVLRLNHLGDWGTQFGMLIAYLKENNPDVLTGKKASDLSDLVVWYRQSKGKFDEDQDFKKKAQLEVVELQSGNPESLAAWRHICEVSRVGYEKIYKILEIKITDRGESFYNPLLKPLVHDLNVRGLLEVSDGAQCMFLEGFKNREGQPLPLILQKSDGGFNYETTDLAALRHRIETEQASRIIYVHDLGQAVHFMMVIKAAQKAEYLDPRRVRVDYVGFGVVLGEDGKRFRTRSGETERLIDLLDKAVAHAQQIIAARNPNRSPTEIAEAAKILGIDAIKYADLSTNRHHDYTFSYDKMLKLEGNTAAFLLYAYVRIAGIKRKVKVDLETVLQTSHIELQHPSEIDLGLHLARFHEVLELITQDLLPNHLADYLYALAEKFNAFFRDCRVEGAPEQNQRLLLCELTSKVMKTGLNILGLKSLGWM